MVGRDGDSRGVGPRGGHVAVGVVGRLRDLAGRIDREHRAVGGVVGVARGAIRGRVHAQAGEDLGGGERGVDRRGCGVDDAVRNDHAGGAVDQARIDVDGRAGRVVVQRDRVDLDVTARVAVGAHAVVVEHQR